jgi:hypothetical protein
MGLKPRVFETQNTPPVMPSANWSDRHPTGHSRVHGVHLACEVLKQVQHDIPFNVSTTLNFKPIAINKELYYYT